MLFNKYEKLYIYIGLQIRQINEYYQQICKHIGLFQKKIRYEGLHLSYKDHTMIDNTYEVMIYVYKYFVCPEVSSDIPYDMNMNKYRI